MVGLGRLDQAVGDGGGACEVKQVLAVDHGLGRPRCHPGTQRVLGVAVPVWMVVRPGVSGWLVLGSRLRMSCQVTVGLVMACMLVQMR